MHIDGSVFVASLARERQELAGEIGGVAGRGEDLTGVGRDGLGIDQPPREQIGVRHDRHELVVEIMGDPAGELADGLELLGLTELALEIRPLAIDLFADGDVPQETLDADDPAIGIANESGGHLAPERRPVLAEVLELQRWDLEVSSFGQSESVLKRLDPPVRGSRSRTGPGR